MGQIFGRVWRNQGGGSPAGAMMYCFKNISSSKRMSMPLSQDGGNSAWGFASGAAAFGVTSPALLPAE